MFPSLDDMVAPQLVEILQAASAEDDVRGDVGFFLRERSGKIVSGYGLVNRVRLDVLVVEVRCVPAESQFSQRVAVTPVRLGRCHLEEGEVAYDRTSPAPVQTEEGHDVHSRQGDAGKTVHITAVGIVQTEGPHRVSEQDRVHRFGLATSVFIALDLDKCGFGLPSQSRDDPRMRVGFLQLVGRAMLDELFEALDGGVFLEVAAERTSRIPLGEDRQS